MPEDFIDEVRKAKAAERAHQAALAPPQRPHRATNGQVGGSGQAAYLEGALRAEVDALGGLTKGTRNPALNIAAFNLGQLVNPTGLQTGVHGLNPQRIQSELEGACRRNGLWDDPEDGPNQCLKTLQSGYRAGLKQPRDLSDVGQDWGRANGRISAEAAPRSKRSDAVKSETVQPNHQQDSPERILRLQKLSGVKSRVPMWVWDYNGYGRIQLGTLIMFAGRPAAGKSTAVRWFAARLSRGELPGVWFGHPMKVAVLMLEEQTDALVVPGLLAAGADLENVFEPKIKFGDNETSLMSIRDEHLLRDELCDNGVRALFVDPVMSTFDKGVDIYRNNDVRLYLQPYMRIAQAINGIVVCVTHLRKGQVRDVIDNINGSSAFGELPRAVFGFAPVGDGTHIIEQVKNSAGPTGLKLVYELPITSVKTDDEQVIDLPHFNITGESELSISDLGGDNDDQDATTASADVVWLREYLLIEQPAASARIKQDAKQQAEISESRLHRARRKLGVRIINHSTPDKPHQTAWCLPGAEL